MEMTSVVSAKPATRSEIARLLSAILSVRFVANCAFRMAYAFAPELSRGLGVDLQTWSTLVGVRSGMGVLAPVFGALSDRFGRRAVMLGGAALSVAGALLAFVSGTLLPFAIGFMGSGLAKVVFEPSASAYLGDRVPYERRGFVMGMSELGWSGAALIGGPVIAVAIKVWGWQSPFALLAAAGLAALLWTAMALPNNRQTGLRPALAEQPAPAPLHAAERVNPAGTGVKAAFAAVGQERSAWLMLAIVFAFLFASDMVAISYAAFLERAFNVDVLALGSIVATFAIADMGGELLSMWAVDRFGKKRALYAGFAATIAAYWLLPLLGASLALAVGALFFYYLCFEFTIVSVFPLISELVPRARHPDVPEHDGGEHRAHAGLVQRRADLLRGGLRRDRHRLRRGRRALAGRVRDRRSGREVLMYSFEELSIRGRDDKPVPNTFFRQNAATSHLALVLPGMGYTCQMPLLYYPTLILLELGADVLQVRYDYSQNAEFHSQLARDEFDWLFADADAAWRAALAGRAYNTFTLIGKSLGTLAMGHLIGTVERLKEADAVWLTPLLRSHALVSQIERAAPRSLFVIGTADPNYDEAHLAAVKAATDGEAVVIEGANHSMEIGGQFARSLEAHTRIMHAVQQFVRWAV